MISGRQTASSIERAILGVRAEEEKLAVMARTSAEEAVRLRTEQAEDFKALAAIRLEALLSKEVAGEIDRVERQALDLVERGRQRLSSAADRRASALEAAHAAEADHAKKAAAVDALGDRIEGLAAGVEASIQGDPAWKTQQERVVRAEIVARAGAEKAAQAESDRESKGKPYEDDSLFMYLWRSGYGTNAYRGGALVRFFDAKVARLIGYDEARPNYHMLNEIPLRLREHADRLVENIEKETAKRDALERKALEAKGIVALENELDDAEKAFDAAAARLEKAKADLTALDAGAAEADQDPDYRKAIEILSERLGRQDLQTLYRQALATPTPADEQIVQKLHESGQKIARAEAEVHNIRKTAVDLARKRAELEQSLSQFHQRGYGDPMGGFTNGDVIGGVIGGILSGALRSRNLDDALNGGFRQRQPRLPGGFGGGLRLPRGGSGGGGLGRPSTGGGGFRTGGRF